MNMNPDQTIARKPGRPRKDAPVAPLEPVVVVTHLRHVPSLVAPCCGTGITPKVARWRTVSAYPVEIADCSCPRCSPPRNLFIYIPEHVAGGITIRASTRMKL